MKYHSLKNPDFHYRLHVEGESMEPVLRLGDLMLIDRRDAAAIPRDGIYVVRMNSSLLMRVQRLPGGKLRLTSENPSYDPFLIDVQDQDPAAGAQRRSSL